MAFGKMAPQAYTKQILQEAFEWWSEQPESFRSQIQDSDDLVGYYLREHRGEATTQAVDDRGESYSKSSKESFSSELKGLAENLSSFEGYPQDKKNNIERPKGSSLSHQQRINKPKSSMTASSSSGSSAASVQNQAVQTAVRSNSIQPQANPAPSSSTSPFNQQQLALPTMSNQLAVTSSQSASASSLSSRSDNSLQGQNLRLDGRSLKMVKEVRELLNLSTDEEALRALISFGSQRFKSLLKP